MKTNICTNLLLIKKIMFLNKCCWNCEPIWKILFFDIMLNNYGQVFVNFPNINGVNSSESLEMFCFWAWKIVNINYLIYTKKSQTMVACNLHGEKIMISNYKSTRFIYLYCFLCKTHRVCKRIYLSLLFTKKKKRQKSAHLIQVIIIHPPRFLKPNN